MTKIVKYTVKPGDTLSAIAREFYGDTSRYQEIATHNQIVDASRIAVGQILEIPIVEQNDATTTAPETKTQETDAAMGKMKVTIRRQPSDDKQTLGELSLTEPGKPDFHCKTLELPWLGNQQRVSCIPVGTYRLVPRSSQKFGDHLHVQSTEGGEVPGRSFILIHRGNYHTQILGCILVGRAHADINRDGFLDVTASTDTMADLLKRVTQSTELEIVWAD